MKVTAQIRQINRTLLELYLGILGCGAVCQIFGIALAREKLVFTASLWVGILLALAGVTHMHRTIDRALSLPEGDTAKAVTAGYLFRYTILAVLLITSALTETGNPLVIFLGYFTIKGAAYLQPFTHKLCNKMFHETDPVPQPVMEETEVSDSSNTMTQ